MILRAVVALQRDARTLTRLRHHGFINSQCVLSPCIGSVYLLTLRLARVPVPPPPFAPLKFHGRDPRLPQIWLLGGHPLLLHAPFFKRVFLVMHDSRIPSMKKFYSMVKNELRLPRGTDEGIAAAG